MNEVRWRTSGRRLYKYTPRTRIITLRRLVLRGPESAELLESAESAESAESEPSERSEVSGGGGPLRRLRPAALHEPLLSLMGAPLQSPSPCGGVRVRAPATDHRRRDLTSPRTPPRLVLRYFTNTPTLTMHNSVSVQCNSERVRRFCVLFDSRRFSIDASVLKVTFCGERTYAHTTRADKTRAHLFSKFLKFSN